MEVYYLRVEDKVIPGLDSTMHIQWVDLRPQFERRVEDKGEKFFPVAQANATEFSCPGLKYSGTSSEVHIYIPDRNLWAIFPVKPSIKFRDALRRGVPIKIVLTKYVQGRPGDWRLAFLIARRKESGIYAFNGKKFNLGPSSFDDDEFMDSKALGDALKERITRQKRSYRQIIAAEKLPLPTTISE